MKVQLTLVDLSSYVVVPAAGGGSGSQTRRRTRTPEEEQEDFANVVRLALAPPSVLVLPSSAARNADSAAPHFPPNPTKVENGGTRGDDKQGKNSGCQRCLESFLGGSGSVDDVHHYPPDVPTVTEKSILRFIKLHDRQCMLASALLKSRSYWEDSLCRLELLDAEESVNDESSGGIEDRGRRRCETCGNCPPQVAVPVVDLPRSEYGKPYVPPRTAARTPRAAAAPAVANGDFVHDLSVSHQYPHVGLARLIGRRRRWEPDHHRRSLEVAEPAGSKLDGLLHVGMDIVVVDEERLSTLESIGEYLSCFEGSFVPSEWGEIMSAGRSGTEVLGPRTLRGMQLNLKEFHVRWAMKEAYSKALGYGLGLDFDSFEIVSPEEVVGGGSSSYTSSSSSFSWYLYLRSNGRSSIEESRSPEEEEPFDSSGGTAGGTTDAANNAVGAAAMIPRLVRIKHVRDNVRWSGVESSSSSPSPSSSSCMGAAATRQREETWQFWFMFLDDDDVGGGDGDGDGPTNGAAMSLVCMCVGPVHADDDHQSPAFSTSESAEVATVDVRRESMDGLLRWHHGGVCSCDGGDD